MSKDVCGTASSDSSGPTGDSVGERRDSPMLSAMTVIDISQQLPGPYASGLLAELGASVVKVEPPQGDPARSLDPQMFALVNSHKRVINLDLKTSVGVKYLHELVARADVFIEGFRPGVAERLGAGWPVLSGINPGLVYCSISASGKHGPYSNVPMHDLNLQGLAGIDTGIGIGVPWVDLGTATTAALAISAAWQAAVASGRGHFLDIAMLDTAVLWRRVKAGAVGRREPTYDIFSTADNSRVAIAILEDHIWFRLCHAFRWDDWLVSTDFKSYSDRLTASEEIHQRLTEACLALRLDELLSLAREYDLPLTPVGPVLEGEAAIQLSERGLDDKNERQFPLPVGVEVVAGFARGGGKQ